MRFLFSIDSDQEQTFIRLATKASTACLAAFVAFLLILLIDGLFRSLFRKGNKDDPYSVLLKCLRTAIFSTVIVFFSMVSAIIRRTFTNAASFDIPQMWWHSLFSAINISFTLLLNHLAGHNTKDLGIKKFGFSLSKWVIRILVVTAIVTATHCVTPMMYSFLDCFGERFDIDYSHSTVGYMFWFFFVQQFCFIINAIDEETAWRGFINALFMKDNESEKHPPLLTADGERPQDGFEPMKPTVEHGRWTMYIITGAVYALCHVNNASSSINSYLLVLFNIICEGAIWMYLYRSSGDLPLNWTLHYLDDMFSIWFGMSVLAGYALPFGQISPFTLGCRDSIFVTGGVFGTGGSWTYTAQNAVTAIMVTLFRVLLFSSKQDMFKDKMRGGSIHSSQPYLVF
ncbi:hypothetical protein PCE1_001549 [Barthelona sp. PCE]